MSTFQAIAIVAAIIGLGVPAWIFALALYHAAKRPRAEDPSARYFAYARLLESMHTQIEGGRKKPGEGDYVIEHGPLFAATIRELRAYPEFRDLSLFYLEEINITGSKKFDDIIRNELKAVETRLLEPGNV